MKTKVWKRIGALVLALALIVSGVPQMCIEALADDTTTVTNEFTATGLNAGTEVYNNGSHWRIVLDYEGTYDTGATWASGAYKSWFNYSIDDAKGNGNIVLYQSSANTKNSSLTFQFSKDIVPTDGTANCKLTLKAGTWSTTKNNVTYKTTMTQDVDIYFHEYGVSFGEPRIKSENVKDVYLTKLVNPSYRPYLWLGMSETDDFAPGEKPMPAVGLVDGDWYYEDSDNGIWLDGKWLHGAATQPNTGIEFMKPTDLPTYYRIHPQWFWDDSSTPDGNDPIPYGERITLKGLFVNGGKAINILNSVVEWHADTGKGTSSASGTWIILPRLLELTEGTTVDNGQWKIYMSHTGQLVGETGETFTGKAMIGDEEIDVQIYADGSNMVIAPPADKVPTDGTEVTMTLKTGDITGTAGSTSMIVNDVTFCINKYGLSLDEPIEAPDTTEMYIQRVQQNSNSYLWFAMSKADTVTKGSVLAPVAGGFSNGKYYHDTNSGVWINGVWEDNTTGTGDIHFYKTTENLNPSTDNYYRVHQQWYSNIVNGSRIKIQGIFEASDGNTIEVETSVMECQMADDGTQKWILLPRLLDVAKATKENNQWKIYMNYVGTLAGQKDEVFIATAYNGETAYDVKVYAEGDYLVLVPDANALPTNGSEATITLKAGDISGSKDSESMIVNDVTICVNKYGVSLDEPIPSYTIVENKLSSLTTYEGETWDIYMKQSGSFLGEKDEVFKWPATIAGEDGTVDVYAKNLNDVIYFNPVIPDSDVLKPASGKVEVVLKATTVTGTKGTQNELKEAVTLYFDKNGLSVDDSTLEDVQRPTESMKLMFGPAGNNINGIYFYCSQTGNIEPDGSWNIRPTVVGGYKDGVCYRGDGGVYITDPEGNTTKFSPNSSATKIPSLIKLSYLNGRVAYYIGINQSHEIETGTKVTIKGVYNWNGAYDSISETVVEWDGGQWINITPADDTAVEFDFDTTGAMSTGTCKRIHLRAVDGINTDKTTNSYNTNYIDAIPGEDNGVFYNGVRKEVQIYKLGGTAPYTSGLYHVVLEGDGITAEADDEVVIKGRFHSNGHIVEYKEVRFVFDGSKWVKSTVATRVNLSDADKEDATSIGFTTDIKDELTSDAVNVKKFAVGGIYVNGKYNAAAQLFKLDGYYKIDLAGCAMSFAIGDTVTIDGSVEEGDVIVEYMRTVFTYEGNGVWALTESGIPEQPVRFELNAAESYKADNGDWKLLFTAADGLRGDPGVEADATYSGLVALVNGVPKDEPTFFKNSKSYYEVTIPSGALPENGDTYEIVIKRGTINGGWEDKAGRYMQKEITLYISGDRISDKGTPTGTDGVQLSYASGDETAVNLLLGSEDSMIVTTKNGATIVAASEPNSGVFINGVKQSTIGIFKFEENSSIYYNVPFDKDLYQPTVGDVIVVNGTFEMANYYVTFDAVAMRWNGSAWAEIEDLTSIALNDVEFDASDDAFLIETFGTTVNGEVVDAGTVLYKEGEYSIVYNIGTTVMTQKLNVVYDFTSEGNNGAGKADTTLPTGMVTGNANAADQYITDVKATTHGTTVISMDRDNSYKTEADFDDYGLDYVVDIKMDSDREFKVLQLADTQTLDSEQQTRSIGATLSAQTVPEKQFENLQYYIDKVVAESKPDIILIAGDLIYAEFDDNGSRWLDLIEYMDSLQIPWAPIFGNHDPESKMGLDWQCEQMMNSTYCLFNRRHEGIGGNSNYSIGLARNGKLEKAVYMLDSNGCGSVARSGNTWSTWGYDDDGNMTEVRAASGFYQTQIEWYKKAAMRVNAVAGDIIPSIQCYHIGTEEVSLAARAAGYQYGDEQAGNKYAFSNDKNAEKYLANGNVNRIVRPQTGDHGYKMGSFEGERDAKGMLEIMNAVGTTGVFLGHNHSINTSMTYGGVRWTYGLKTGIYADDTVKKGGTLITLDQGADTFELQQIHVELEYSEPSLDADKTAENNANTIYLNGNATRDAMPVQAESLVVSKDAESGIFVNAVKSDAIVEKYEEDKYKVTLAADAEAGDVVSVYGIFDNSDGTHGVYFQKTLVLKYDGNQWNAIKVDWLNGSTVQVNATGADYEKAMNYLLTDLGFLPYSTAEFPYELDEEGKIKLDEYGNKLTKKNMLESVSTYGDNWVYCKLDNVVYTKTIALYIPGDSHVDETVDVLDLVAMKKAENGEEPTTETEKYADQLGSKGLREKLVGK